MKRKALFVITIALVVCLAACKDTESNSESVKSGTNDYYQEGREHEHEIKPVTSVELVSQKKPLAFFELMEQPQIEGVKVRINYEDGSSELVDAYELTDHGFSTGPEMWYTHWKGMLFAAYTVSEYYLFSETAEPFLQPGKHRIAMYYLDTNLYYDAFPTWTFAHNPEKIKEDIEFPYCMVDVYAQTPEEYIAERNHPFVTITDSGKDTLPLGKGEKGLIKLQAKESGMYSLDIQGEYHLKEEVVGSGKLLSGGKYVQLNANKPMYLRVDATGERGASLSISLLRVPEAAIALGETIMITEPTVLRIKGKDADGNYILTGEKYERFENKGDGWEKIIVLKAAGADDSVGRLELEPLRAIQDGQLMIPCDGKPTAVTLRMKNIAIPEKEIRLKKGDIIRLDETITTDFRGNAAYKIEPAGIAALLKKDSIVYLHGLKKGKTSLTLSGENHVKFGAITISVE